MTEFYRYAAFISYASKDAAFARRLHRVLETYRIPSSLGKFDLVGGGKRNRIYPVFRDREELSAGHLSDQIEASLRASAALIVVCSPHSAASPWVQKEIDFFAALRRDKIFAIISDSAPLTNKSGDDATTACFPPALSGDDLAGDRLQPLAADARKGKDGFRGAWLKLVAGMIGISPGKIVNRDRRRRGNQAFTGAVLLALAVLGYTQRATLKSSLTSLAEYRLFANGTMELSNAIPGTTFKDCHEPSTDCPLMVVIPAGRFTMGSAPDDPDNAHYGDEFPQRLISISRFAVSRYEITFENWQACVDGGGCDGYQSDRQLDDDIGHRNYPVINVTWDHAQEYVAWLSRMTGRRYRLLTEAEWEFAARGHTTEDAPHTRFSWGNADPECRNGASNGAVFHNCAQQQPWKVHSFPANSFGLYDMHGNVWEWVEDCYALYDPASLNGAAYQYDGECQRVVRGGSWADNPRDLRSAQRAALAQGDRYNSLGFRVARTL